MHSMNPFVTLRERALRSISDLKIYDDLVKKSRSMPTKPGAKLKVIGAGQPRTGTLSMYTAMLELGFKSYHGIELVINPDMCNRWNDVIEADLSHGSTEQVDWDQVMEGYEATFDGPACHYWLELAKAFPDVKLVYTHRDGKTWVDSYVDTLRKPMIHNTWYRIAVVWFPMHARMYKTAVLADKKLEVVTGLRPEAIDERLEEIKKHISEDRLLVFHPSQGWEPLCKFLEVPIPSTPFPRVNDGPSLAWVSRAITIIGMSLWVLVLAVVWRLALWFLK